MQIPRNWETGNQVRMSRNPSPPSRSRISYKTCPVENTIQHNNYRHEDQKSHISIARESRFYGSETETEARAVIGSPFFFFLSAMRQSGR